MRLLYFRYSYCDTVSALSVSKITTPIFHVERTAIVTNRRKRLTGCVGFESFNPDI